MSILLANRNALLSLLLTLCCSVKSTAQQKALLNRVFRASFTKGTILSYIENIQEKTGVTISYSTATIDPNKKVKLKGNEETIEDVLIAILASENADILEREGKILIIPAVKEKKPVHRTYTISGFVRDKHSKEVLIGAVVYVPSINVGAVTNNYGYYSLTLPAGYNKAIYRYIEYKADTVDIEGESDRRIDILLEFKENNLDEVVIYREEKSGIAADHLHLTGEDIYKRQALFGENDIMRRLQNTSGVQTASDGFSTIVVRGGDPGQNLNLLDGVPLYYVDHFDGLTSVYNTESVKSVDFYKGNFPARYGGRLSSIIDVNTKDGDMDRIGGQFTMGLLKASLNLEGPIVKERSSLMLAARRTWIDGLFAPFAKGSAVNFYDVNLKFNYIINKNNRIYASFYNGRDRLNVNISNTQNRTSWQNNISAVKWTSIINPKAFFNITLTYSAFNFEMKDNRQTLDDVDIKTGDSYTGASSVKDLALRLQLRWTPNTKHNVDAGLSYSYAFFVPVEVKSKYASGQTQNISTAFRSNEVTLYVEDDIKLGPKWTIRPGLHWANWFSSKFTYSSLQPRLFTSFKASASSMFYLSFSQMAQFLHLINSNTYGLPQGFWIPSTAQIEPEESLMGALGYSLNTSGNLHFNMELYYKDIYGVTAYSQGKDIFDNTDSWQNKLTQGKGWSYGIETNIDKKIGAFVASAAYTLSWNWRKFDLLNDGKKFPYRYDRRHNLKLSLIYTPGKNTELTANWTYMTGEAITLPDQVYPDLDRNLMIQTTNSSTPSSNYTYYYTQWNNYRLPAIHRLDVGINFHKKKKKHMERTWSIGVFNAYGRRNVMSVDLVSDATPGEFQLKGISLFNFVPYLSYRLKF